MTVLGLLGILVGLGLLISFAFRGWSVLLLAPLAALIAALFSREPLLAHWTQTFGSYAKFPAANPKSPPWDNVRYTSVFGRKADIAF